MKNQFSNSMKMIPEQPSMKRHIVMQLMVVLGLLTSVPLLWAEKPAATAPSTKPITYNPGREIAQLANPAISESSGLACGRATPGVFWTHNDSGDGPRLFALNLKGEDLGTYLIHGAATQDWEDMCSFSITGKHYLLVADCGDNRVQRENCNIYIVAEPAIIPKQSKPQQVALFMQQDFTYEDGPRNCESVAVDPVRREIVLVSKTSNQTCTAYVIPLQLERTPKKAVAKPVATLTIPTATAMDISPDGLRALVLTYGAAYEYTRQPDEDWSRGFGRPPRIIDMPARAQGESACYGSDGMTIYLTSEKIPTPLLEVTPSNIEPLAPALVPPAAIPHFKTVADAQKAAIGRYPDLGIKGSPMSTESVVRYKLYKQQQPEYFRDTSWPIRLAEEIARDLNAIDGVKDSEKK